MSARIASEASTDRRRTARRGRPPIRLGRYARHPAPPDGQGIHLCRFVRSSDKGRADAPAHPPLGHARENGSFGLTTLCNRHVTVAGSELRFHFTGKSGKERRLAISDRRVARVVRACQSLPGQQLFQYRDDTGARVGITSADINGYLREITGRDVTAKDFRTWGGTMMAAAALRVLPPFGTRTEAKKSLNEVVKRAARKLGNTPAICRRCYIHPHIIECYGQGRLAGDLVRAADQEKATRALRREEAAVLALLKGHRPPRRKAARRTKAALLGSIAAATA